VLEAYRAHAAERAALGIPPLPLTAKQTGELVDLLLNPPKGEEAFLVDLLTLRVPAGVDDAAKVKAAFLAKVSTGETACALLSREKATELLGTMLGGYNVKPLIDLLDDAAVGAVAASGLKGTLLMFDYFHDVAEKAKKGNANAKSVMQSWADAEWFTQRPEVAKKISVTVFKVTGETNTDDLSPAPDAWSRPDIPLHGLAMLKNAREGIVPEKPGERGPIQLIEDLKKKGHPVAYVGDVVGTGSSRKSATNSVIWWTGDDIPFVPNKRYGGFCLGGKIAPIFFNTQEDAGAFPIECDVSQMNMGDVVDIYPYDKKVEKNGQVIATFAYKSEVLLDEVRAGGRINLIIGRGADRPRARGAGPARQHAVPPAAGAEGFRQGLLAGPEDGRPRLRPARGQGRPPGHLLRAEDDHRRLPGHHRPDDARRAEGPRLPRLLRRHGDAVLLPHRRLSEAGGRAHAPRIAFLHLDARRRGAAPRRRRHPLLAE
jgi:aconitate hydratase 2/2-methylisocitrate dehydratase